MTYTTYEDLFSTFHYPAGESHVRLVGDLPAEESLVIEARVRCFDELCSLLTADDILRQHRQHARWFVPYFPFARHDRRIDDRDGLELQLALKMVADLDITIADPHSDVAGQLRHLRQDSAVELFARDGLFEGDPLVIIPDAGASKKADGWIGDRRSIQCGKHRDPRTGKLSAFGVPVADLAGAPCVIVDDICDGGGTFIGLAEELAARNAGDLRLAVTHGLFTKGFTELARHFQSIRGFVPSNSVPAETQRFHPLPYKDLYLHGENS